ncbi:MAG TPA: DUF695 domain-containing protein [Candidatus Angelobacter sp.]|jgi:hypothetical protein|nr:DUF695 domain-containing protein [Candidatus Angelobacter sp.]
MPTDQDLWSLKRHQPKGSSECHFFRKNLAPKVGVRHPHYCFIVYLTFAYSPEDARGLPSPEDEDTLFEIESVGLRELEADGLALQVATATKCGVKDFLFYTSDPEQFLLRAEKLRDLYQQFRVGCEIASDPEWKHYEQFP